MRTQFKTIKSKVQQILTDLKETRDDNAKLINWYYLEFHEFANDASYLKFIGMLIRKEIPSIETLTRLSRQVQEQNPELRGEKWHQRKTVKTEIAKKDLGYNSKS
jgi:hypothetical protein